MVEVTAKKEVRTYRDVFDEAHHAANSGDALSLANEARSIIDHQLANYRVDLKHADASAFHHKTGEMETTRSQYIRLTTVPDYLKKAALLMDRAIKSEASLSNRYVKLIFPEEFEMSGYSQEFAARKYKEAMTMLVQVKDMGFRQAAVQYTGTIFPREFLNSAYSPRLAGIRYNEALSLLNAESDTETEIDTDSESDTESDTNSVTNPDINPQLRQSISLLLRTNLSLIAVCCVFGGQVIFNNR